MVPAPELSWLLSMFSAEALLSSATVVPLTCSALMAALPSLLAATWLPLTDRVELLMALMLPELVSVTGEVAVALAADATPVREEVTAPLE